MLLSLFSPCYAIFDAAIFDRYFRDIFRHTHAASAPFSLFFQRHCHYYATIFMPLRCHFADDTPRHAYIDGGLRLPPFAATPCYDDMRYGAICAMLLMLLRFMIGIVDMRAAILMLTPLLRAAMLY